MLSTFKKSSVFQFAVLLILFGAVGSVYSSHIAGGDISYRYLGSNQYEVTLNLFRDCSGITTNSSESISISSNCGLSTSITATLQNPGGTEVSQLCAAQMLNSTCNSGSQPGMQHYIYKGTYTFASMCDSITFSWSQCCRNTSVNVPGSSSDDMYISAVLYGNSWPTDNSPLFTAQPIPYVCANQPVTYNYGVMEADGDSLRFKLIAAKTSATGVVTYGAGYSGTSPITGITVNANTGQIAFTPTTIGNFIVTIGVYEYSSTGVLKGFAMRDIQFVVQSCTNNQPASTGGVITGLTGTATQTGSYSLKMCEGNSFSFTASFSDPDGSDILTLTSNVTTALPGSTISFSGTNPRVATITWTAPGGSAGNTNIFTIEVQDDACPIPGLQTMVYDIQVVEATTAGADLAYCPAGGPVQLNATGGTTFSWAPATGLSCTNCASPTASPSVTTTYIVTSNLTSSCKNKDTVIVRVVPDFTLNVAPATSTICLNGGVTLTATPSVAGTYTYSWTPVTGLSASTVQNPLAQPTTTSTYSVTATSSQGCKRNGTAIVNVSGVAPLVTLAAGDTTLCLGESTTLTPTVYNLALACGVPSSTCASPTTYTLGAGTSSSSSVTPYKGYYHDGRIQILYTKAELNAAGVYGGVIKNLAFNVATKSSTAAYSGFTIKMGCTTASSLTSTFINGLTTVYSGNYTSAAGWNSYNTSGNGYEWDGTTNLVVEVCFDNNAYTSSDAVYYTTTSYTSVTYGDMDSSPSGGCSLAGEYTSTFRPDIRFGICSLPGTFTYSWSPAAGLSSTTVANPTATPTTTTTYVLNVTNTGTGCVGAKSIVIYVGGNNFTLSATANSTICAGTSRTITATPSIAGTYVYEWNPTTGLANPSAASTTASPSSTTTYTVTASSGGAGCTKTASTIITVKNRPTVTMSAADTTLCIGEATSFGTTAYVTAVNCGIPAAACTGSTTTISIGTGTSTSTTTTPYKGGWEDGRVQMLYTKSELNAQGITGGVIKTFALKMGTKNSSANYTGFNIKMGCTSISATSTNFVSGLTTVYSNNNQAVTANSWNTYTLTGNGYEWDGVSNLIVEVCFDNADWTSSDPVEYSTTAFNSVTYADADGSTGCTMVGEYTSTLRPNAQFGFCTPSGTFTYAWTPTTGLSSSTSATPTLTSGTGAGQAPVGTYTYSVTVTDGSTSCSTVMTEVVRIGNTFNLTMSPAATICSGSSTQLSAEVDTTIGTLSYYWSPAATLNNPNIYNPTASPTGNQLYTVNVVSSQGCSKSGSTTITVGPGNLTVTATAGASPICKGSSTTLTSNATTAAPTCQTYAAGCSSTSTSATIGSGTSAGANTTSPFFKQKSNSHKRQFIYTAAELTTAMGGGAGARVISGIGFDVTTAGTSISDVAISIGCSSSATLTTTFNTSLTVVRPAAAFTPSGTGWNYITFTTPYLWDGTSNLIIQVCTNTKAGATGHTLVRSTSGLTDKTAYYHNNTAGACNNTTGTLSAERPNLRLSYCAYVQSSISYSWTPTTGLSSSTVQNPTAAPSSTTTYYVTAVDPGTGCSSVDDVVVEVNEVIAGPDLTVCSGNSTTLSASPTVSGSVTCGSNTGAACSSTSAYTAGTGTSVDNIITPFNSYYEDGRYQMLFLASELNTLGMTGGKIIKSIELRVGNKISGTQAFSGFTIKMGCTSITALTTTFETVPTVVYGPVDYTDVGNSFNLFNLSGNGYVWDGTSNLIVEICYHNTTYVGPSSDEAVYSTTAFNSVSYRRADNSVGCTMTGGTVSNRRINTRFNVCATAAPVTYSWSPAGSISSGATTATPTTGNLTSATEFIVTAVQGSCTMKDTVRVTMAAPASLTWTGTTNTDWFTRTNWSSNCIPECATTVTIPSGLTNYPNITATGAACNTITIQSGATLSMAAAGTLAVCGDFINNGTISINPSATVTFNNGSVNQSINGNISGTNKFGNLTITKTGGSVNILQNIDIGGAFLTSNATSVCNTNGMYIKVAGNFTNSSGGTTFTNVGTTTGTLEFNGSASQTFTPGGALTLNNVVMNHSGTGVTLAGDMTLGTAGTLSLNMGKIITGAAYKVTANNTATSSVSTGSTTSYVEGFLRRYIASTGSYDFPVGNSSKGYQRANIEFTSATTISYLTADFQNYSTVPAALGSTECTVTYNYNALDNGFWNIEANTANNNSGVYTMTLYNRSYSNATTTNGWTVMSRHNGSATWALVNGDGSTGICVGSPVTAVQRQGMKGFSKFGTAQSTLPLPIKLLSFSGESKGEYNLLEWVTASEVNNNYFVVERINDNSTFTEIGRVKGAGTIGVQQYYNLPDYTFENKINYYRLTQVDFNGDVMPQGIISIDNRSVHASKLELFPNPANTELFLLMDNVSDAVDVEVISYSGQLVMRSKELFKSGVPVRLNIGELATGLYVVKLRNRSTGELQITRFTKGK